MQAFSIDGMTTKDELMFLARLVQGKNGNIVEVGSYLGRSAVLLAEASGNDAKVFAVDPYEFYQVDTGGTGNRKYFIYTTDNKSIMLENVKQAGFADKVTHIHMKSPDAAKGWQHGEIDLLFIDAMHDYESVKADFDAWSPFVGQGGVVALHDFNSEPGVMQLAQEIEASGDYERIGEQRMLVGYRKIKAATIKTVTTSSTSTKTTSKKAG